jgi:hypothetical protein
MTLFLYMLSWEGYPMLNISTPPHYFEIIPQQQQQNSTTNKRQDKKSTLILLKVNSATSLFPSGPAQH